MINSPSCPSLLALGRHVPSLFICHLAVTALYPLEIKVRPISRFLNGDEAKQTKSRICCEVGIMETSLSS